MVTVTIYDRYGGFATIRKIVSAFYDKALDSPQLAHHFENVEMPRLIDHQAKFISYLTGGPASYSDNHLQRVHARLGITKAEFDEMTELLRETLEDHDLEPPDIEVVYEELRRREPLVVTAG